MCPLNEACELLHGNTYSAGDKSQEWSLVRFSPPPVISPTQHPNRSPSPIPSFERPSFYLQNVRSQLYITQRDGLEGQNIFASSRPSSTWYFMYIRNFDNDDQTVAIVSSTYHSTLDHCGGSYIASSSYLPMDPFNLWVPIPRNGSFVLKNRSTGQLLCHDERQPNVISTKASVAVNDTSCHWRVVGAAGSTTSVIYDSALSSLALGDLAISVQPVMQMPPSVPTALRLK